MAKEVKVTKVVRFDEESLDAFNSLVKFGKDLAAIARNVEIIVDEIRSQVRLETLETTIEDGDVEIYFNG